MDASLIAANLLTPAVLFFVVGLLGTLLRSDLEIPGERGRQLADDLTGVSSNHLILTPCPPAALGPLVEELRAVLVRAGGMCLVSDAAWLRH